MRGTLFIGILTVSIFAAGCSESAQSVSIADTGKDQVVVLKKDSGLGKVYALSIQGHGNIDGKATIMLMLNGKPYKTEHLENKVNFEWGGDWYLDEAEIRYIPKNVSSGNISLEYNFS